MNFDSIYFCDLIWVGLDGEEGRKPVERSSHQEVDKQALSEKAF